MARFRFVLFLFLLATTWWGCENHAIEPTNGCKPLSFFLAFDSIHLDYNGNGQLQGLSRFAASPAQNETEEYQYSNGQLFSGAATSVAAPSRAYHQWTLTYGTDGLPSKLSEQWIGYYGQFVTVFTHDAQGRLVQGLTRVFNGVDPNGTFVGGFTYTYNNHDNVTQVKYIINDGTGKTKEVVARENLTFDNADVFYHGSKDLTVRNVYVYHQLPNRNNVLSATIYYASYIEAFTTPLTLNFELEYDKAGRIRSFVSNYPAEPQQGDLLYTRLQYECN